MLLGYDSAPNLTLPMQMVWFLTKTVAILRWELVTVFVEKQHTWGAKNNETEENESRSNDQLSKIKSAGKVTELKWTNWSLHIFLYSSLSHLFVCVCAKSFQLCPTLYEPMGCSQPNSFVHGSLQARILEWVAIPFSKGFFQPRDRIHFSYVSCIGRCVLYH